MLADFKFDDVDQCVRLAKQAIDKGLYDGIAEAIYVGLSAYPGHMDRFVREVGPYYYEHNE